MTTKRLTLKDLSATEASIKLVHPKVGELDVFITMLGPDSNEFIELGKKLMKGRGAKTDVEITPDEQMKEGINLLAGLITGWSDDEFFGGAATPKNVKAVLSEQRWIREQLQEALEDRKSFFLA